MRKSLQKFERGSGKVQYLSVVAYLPAGTRSQTDELHVLRSYDNEDTFTVNTLTA